MEEELFKEYVEKHNASLCWLLSINHILNRGSTVCLALEIIKYAGLPWPCFWGLPLKKSH